MSDGQPVVGEQPQVLEAGEAQVTPSCDQVALAQQPQQAPSQQQPSTQDSSPTLSPQQYPQASPQPSGATAAPTQQQQQPQQQVTNSGKLFVGQVPAVCTEEMLLPLFQPYGTILEIKIMRDHQGRSKGCAWVRYETQVMAQAAIDALHEKHTIPPQTNALRVQYALQSKPHAPRMQQQQQQYGGYGGGGGHGGGGLAHQHNHQQHHHQQLAYHQHHGQQQHHTQAQQQQQHAYQQQHPPQHMSTHHPAVQQSQLSSYLPQHALSFQQQQGGVAQGMHHQHHQHSQQQPQHVQQHQQQRHTQQQQFQHPSMLGQGAPSFPSPQFVVQHQGQQQGGGGGMPQGAFSQQQARHMVLPQQHQSSAASSPYLQQFPQQASTQPSLMTATAATGNSNQNAAFMSQYYAQAAQTGAGAPPFSSGMTATTMLPQSSIQQAWPQQVQQAPQIFPQGGMHQAQGQTFW